MAAILSLSTCVRCLAKREETIYGLSDFREPQHAKRQITRRRLFKPPERTHVINRGGFVFVGVHKKRSPQPTGY